MIGTGPKRNASGKSDPHGEIAGKLKSLYDTVENEPVPDMFLDLLNKLDEAERKAKSK
ncbi:NepR family anti-sigma factor [Pararhizobium sp.]|uniref:NepR family anti-sigma factor n=1 Tax=Pararhizobium sp. TaxID=1977563 RepID=UPI00271EE9A1|nr:NepR family anti-sigma factor [Pararhizobium sp.]MDO9418326.1 NepR family anti-sigma factor [Pararhizobium sp.]